MKLKNCALNLCALVLATSANAGVAPSKNPTPVAPAPEQNLGLTLDVGYDTTDVWQGVDFGDNWVSTGITYQREVNETVGVQLDTRYGVSADDSFRGYSGLSYERLELGAMATVDLKAVELGLGYRWFHQMGDMGEFMDDSNQVGATLTKDIGPVAVGLAGYYDFASSGWIFNADVGGSFAVTDRISILPSAGIIYAVDHEYWEPYLEPLDGFVSVNVRLAISFKLTDNASLVPYIAARFPIDALEAQGSENLLYGGVQLSVSF